MGKATAGQDQTNQEEKAAGGMKKGNIHREENDKESAPENMGNSHHQDINDKYSNNLQPIDELPEITNPNVRMSIDKFGSYVHQSSINLEESMHDQADMTIKITKRFDNEDNANNNEAVFQGEVQFDDKNALEYYHKYGDVVFKDDSRYEGDFAYGKFDGRGRFIHGNGDMYIR